MTPWLLSLLLLSPTAVPEIELHPLHGLKADVATLIVAGREGGALRAAAVAAPGSGTAADGSRRVAVWVAVDNSSLFEDASSEELQAPLQTELYVYAMTPERELAASVGRRLRLPSIAPPGSRLELVTFLDLPPGDYQLRVLLRELRSQRFALLLEPLSLAPDPESPDTKSPTSEDTTADAGAAAAPVVEGGWIIGPGAGGMMPAAASSALFARDPWSRPPGSGATPDSAPAAPRISKRTARRIRTAVDGYRAVLARLASGGLDDAVDALRELERKIGAHEDPGRAWELNAAQDRVIQRLAQADPESLLPLLVLHRERHVRASREARLDIFYSTSSRQRIVDLARLYGEKSRTDLAPTLAATALAYVGASYVRNQMYDVGRPALESALALDDDNVTALLCLAFVEERNGRYESSVDALRRALEVVPTSEEARLRLALSLRRLDRGDEALELLRRLVEEIAEEWLLTIAYEELGRLLLTHEGPEAAARVLEDAVSRLPRQQRLYAQHSYLLDRSGERQRGREVLARMPPDTGRSSPRKLYSEPPCDDSRGRELLLRHATARLPVLADVLARRRGGRG